MPNLLHILRTWWRQDRIRVNRNCGQLLSLQVGDRLLIDNEIFIVHQRQLLKKGNHVHGDLGHTDFAHDTADLFAAELLGEPARDAVPTEVEYLLRACAGGDAPAWYPMEDEASFAIGATSLCQMARLIVPLASSESIYLYGDGKPRELWADDIDVLPRSTGC